MKKPVSVIFISAGLALASWLGAQPAQAPEAAPVTAGLTVAVGADSELAARAAALHRRLFTIDTHLDTPTIQIPRPGWDIGRRHDWPTDLSQCDLPRMREGGLKAAFFAIWLEAGARTPEALLATRNRTLRCLVNTRETIDHVGIGTDMDGGGRLAGLEDVSDFPKITLALLQRGYSEADIAKIWGGNTLRVLRAAEDYARNPRPQPARNARPASK